MRALLSVLATVVIAAVFAIVVLEWFAGCGETYVDAKGRVRAHECLFFNLERGAKP
jgi:hypothetical protein